MLSRSILLFAVLAAGAGGCPLVPAPPKPDAEPKPPVEIATDEAAVRFTRDYAAGLADAAKAVGDKAESDGYYDLQELVDEWTAKAKAAHADAQKPLRERMNSISGKDPSDDPEPTALMRQLEAGFRKAAK